jgi:hypothetical protein
MTYRRISHPVVLLAWLSTPSCAWISPRTALSLSSALHSSKENKVVANDALFAPPHPNRKEKKNKYAKFSKVETSEYAVDPLEKLIRESEEKLKQLQH